MISKDQATGALQKWGDEIDRVREILRSVNEQVSQLGESKLLGPTMCIVIFDLTDEIAVRELAEHYGVPPYAKNIEGEFPYLVHTSHFGTKYACALISADKLVLNHPELVLRNKPLDGCFKVYVISGECQAVHLPLHD